MSRKEIDRLAVIRRVVERRLSQKKAGELIGLCRAYDRCGPPGLASVKRGMPSNRRLSEELRVRAMVIVRERYHDFGPTLAREKLAPDDRPVGKGSLCAQAHAFNLQAATRVAANDKPGRERLCRYVLRPPLANDRLHILPDGVVRLDFKKPWSDGTTSVDLAPLAFIGRLAALVVPAGPRACHTCPCPTRLRRARRRLHGGTSRATAAHSRRTPVYAVKSCPSPRPKPPPRISPRSRHASPSTSPGPSCSAGPSGSRSSVRSASRRCASSRLLRTGTPLKGS